KNVRFVISLDAVKCAERAEFLAHVGVIDISINDVTDDVSGMTPLPIPVRCIGEIDKICFLINQCRFLPADPRAIYCGLQECCDFSHINFNSSVNWMAPSRCA